MSIELINDECGNIQNKYFYFINCSDMEKELCNMEMKSIFKQIPNRKFLFSNKDFNPSRSPFIKFKVNIIYIEESLEIKFHMMILKLTI